MKPIYYTVIACFGLAYLCFMSPKLYRFVFPQQRQQIISKPQQVIGYAATGSYRSKPTRSHYGNIIDTINTVADSDTIYLYPKIKKSALMEAIVTVDSLDGATSGLLTVEESFAGLVWDERYDKMVINGSTRQQFKYRDFIWKNDLIRFKIISYPCTQKTRVTVQYAYN